MLRFWYVPRTFDAEFQAEIDLGLTISEGTDGRILFGVVPGDARVIARVDQAAWTPPPPVQRCTVRQQLRSGLIGGAVVAVGGWVFRG